MLDGIQETMSVFCGLVTVIQFLFDNEEALRYNIYRKEMKNKKQKLCNNL